MVEDGRPAAADENKGPTVRVAIDEARALPPETTGAALLSKFLFLVWCISGALQLRALRSEALSDHHE